MMHMDLLSAIALFLHTRLFRNPCFVVHNKTLSRFGSCRNISDSKMPGSGIRFNQIILLRLRVSGLTPTAAERTKITIISSI